MGRFVRNPGAVTALAKKSLYVLALILLCSGMAGAQGALRAVVVGVAGYQHGYAALDYSARDARRIATALGDIGYSVSLLAADADVGTIKCSDVTRALQSAAEKSRSGDALLFFFAGHGSRRNGKDYLLLSDTDPDAFASTALDFETLAKTMASSKATRRVFIIDACRSTSERSPGKSGFIDGKLDKGFKDALDRLVQNQPSDNTVQTAALYACSPGESSKESVEERAGLFTNRLIQALQQNNASGALTLGEALKYVRDRLPARFLQTPLLVGPETLRLGLPSVRPAPVAPGQPQPLRDFGGGEFGPSRRVNSIDNAVVRLIPEGDFEMGSGQNPAQGLERKHTVHLHSYYIYENLVTVGQYRQFVNEMQVAGRQVAGHAAEMPPEPEYKGNRFNPNWQHVDHPIVNVSWYDAMAYCQWAGGALPTEAQWERAAKGPRNYKFPWGDTFDSAMLWFNKGAAGDAGGTIPVAKYPANGFGLTDMEGNVRQWCLDVYDQNFYSKSGTVDPVNNSPGALRVLRGSAWNYVDPLNFRCADRGRCPVGIQLYNNGFRCVIPVAAQ